MRPYNRMIERRWKEWELRHFGSQAIKSLAHELVTPERYKPPVPTGGELSMDRANAECEAEEIHRLGAFSLDHARTLPHVPGNRFIDGAVEYPSPPDIAT